MLGSKIAHKVGPNFLDNRVALLEDRIRNVTINLHPTPHTSQPRKETKKSTATQEEERTKAPAPVLVRRGYQHTQGGPGRTWTHLPLLPLQYDKELCAFGEEPNPMTLIALQISSVISNS